jgi:hypothetical protein
MAGNTCHRHCHLHRTPRPKLCLQFHPLLLHRRALLLLCQQAHRLPGLEAHPLQLLQVLLRLPVAWPRQHCHRRAWLHQQQQCPLRLGLATEEVVAVCGAWPSPLCQKRSYRRQWTMLVARTEWIARKLPLEAAASTQPTFRRTHHMHSIAIGRRRSRLVGAVILAVLLC